MKRTDLLLLLLLVAGGAYSYSVGPAGSARTTSSPAASTRAGAIPPTFFGMRTSANAPWPSVPFGTYRVFHNGTTWDYLAKQGRNKYRTPFGQSTFKTLDQLLEEGARHGVTQVWYTLYGVATWASSNPSDSNCAELPGSCDPPSDLEVTAPCQGPLSGVTTTDCQFKEFMTGFMDHVCSGTAPNKKCKVTAFGCWNEPDADQFWTGTAAQVAQLCA